MTEPNRYIELWLKDFPYDPYEIAKTLPVSPHLIRRKGELSPVRKNPAKKNLLIFRADFNLDDTWSAAIEKLILTLGGWDAVGELIRRINCPDPLIQFQLPIRNSPHQENNFIEPSVLGHLAALKIDLGMDFGHYRDDAEKIH